MKTESTANENTIPISECPICSTLEVVETSYEKYGSDDSCPLPPAAARLEPTEEATDSDAENNRVLRCPICGTLYHYLWSYEYMMNGSEDEEVLTRLTPSEASRYYTPEAYAARMAAHAAWLGHPHPATRRYAAHCLAADALVREGPGAVAGYLLDPDDAVVWGAIDLLRRIILGDAPPPSMSELQGALERASAHPDAELAGAARYLLGRIAGAAAAG